MAFAIKGANVELGNFAGPGVDARSVPSYPVLHPRQNSTSSAPATNDTINMFIESFEGYEFAASIVEACADQTVLALRCTSANDFVGSQTCGPNAIPATVTYASTLFYLSSAVTTNTRGVQVSATAIEDCKLAGTTAATCSITVGGTADGTKTSTSTQTTLTGTDYMRYNVAITGGAEKTASATATCRAASGKSAGTTLNAKGVMVWALAGVATGVLTML